MSRCSRLLLLVFIAAFPDSLTFAETSPLRNVFADYDAELRQSDGRVDVDAMVARLKELGVTSYYWLVFHKATDWDDLKLFLPKAARAGISVTVYLVPPSESPPHTTLYPEPYRLDYRQWGEEIARLSLQYPNLTSWVIDDFYENGALFTPVYVREMQERAKKINPLLAFLPLMYFGEITNHTVEAYRDVVDGMVVAYPPDRSEIDRVWALLNDAPALMSGDLSFPGDTPSRAGDFVMASQTAKVLPSGHSEIRFREQDDFTGTTPGYHFKQLLVDGEVVWEADVSGGTLTAQEIVVDVTRQVQNKPGVTIEFRLLDRQGVSNFGVSWRVRDLQVAGLQLVNDLTRPQTWQVTRRGLFETSFGTTQQKAQHRFHIPFIVMTAGDAEEFRDRYGAPATPERIAEGLRMSLQAWQEGKCDGVVTYCLDKSPKSETYPSAQKLFHEFMK